MLTRPAVAVPEKKGSIGVSLICLIENPYGFRPSIRRHHIPFAMPAKEWRIQRSFLSDISQISPRLA